MICREAKVGFHCRVVVLSLYQILCAGAIYVCCLLDYFYRRYFLNKKTYMLTEFRSEFLHLQFLN